MHWYLTIPFALGILLSPQIGADYGWICSLLAASMLLLWLVYKKKRNIIPLLFLNTFLLGMGYCHLRSATEVTTGQQHVAIPTNTSYKNNPERSRHKSKTPSATIRRIEESLTRAHLSRQHQAVLSAMLLGDRTSLDRQQKKDFQQAGAQHLLALSGIHLGILLTMLGVLFLPRVRCSRWRWPVFLCIMMVLWSYVAMVGVPKSLLRAALMSSLFLLGKFSSRPTRGYEILGTVVLLMLLADPLCAFDIGAQLSIVALTGLTCFYPVFENFLLPDKYPCRNSTAFIIRNVNRFLRFCFVSLSAWLFTTPLILYHFQQFQPWQPLTSIILIPLTSVVLYGGVLTIIFCMLGCTAAITPLSAFLDKLMDVQDGAIQLCSSLPASCIKVPDVDLWQMLLLYLFFAETWVILRYRSARIMAYASALCIITLLLFTIA